MLEKLVTNLVDPTKVGVVDVADLKYIDENDIKDYLTPIEVRRLLLQVKETTHISDDSSRPGSYSAKEPSQSEDSVSEQGPSPRSKDSPEQENVSIPWFKMPQQLMESLKKEERPSPRLRKEMVRILVDHVNKPGQQLPRKNTLRFIARDAVLAYPCSFRDEVDGMQVGCGHDSLLSQSVNRVDNLGRDTAHNSIKRRLSQGNVVPAKKMVTDSYGCVNWQPSTLPEHETAASQSDKREAMKKALDDGNKDIDIAVLMDSTYASQRKAINRNDCRLDEVIAEWPYLFEEKYLLQHSKTLIGKDLMAKIEESADKKMKTIMNFMGEQDKRGLDETVKLISEACKKRGDNMPTVLGSLMLVCEYAEEDPSTIILSAERPADCDDLDLPGTPCIVAIGKPLETDRFHISVGETVTTKVGNPLAALAVWFALFFVLNLQYPKEAAVVCEFVQRCFFGINPAIGSKSVKAGKKTNTHPVVLRLVNKIMDFEFRKGWDL